MLKKSILLTAILTTLILTNTSLALTWDGGYHLFDSGYEGELALLNDASADITGGHIGILWGEDFSTVNTYDGCIIDLLRPNVNCTANVYGGAINDIFTLGTSTTSAYNGLINIIHSIDSSTVYLYAEMDSFDPTGGIFHDGLLTVTWLDSGDSISIDLAGDGTYGHIFFVPEPYSISIMLFGCICMNNGRNQHFLREMYHA